MEGSNMRSREPAGSAPARPGEETEQERVTKKEEVGRRCRLCGREWELSACACGLGGMCLDCYFDLHRPACRRAQLYTGEGG